MSAPPKQVEELTREEWVGEVTKYRKLMSEMKANMECPVCRGRFPRVFGDEFGEEFGDKFGDDFSESLNLVMNLVDNLATNLVIHQNW